MSVVLGIGGIGFCAGTCVERAAAGIAGGGSIGTALAVAGVLEVAAGIGMPDEELIESGGGSSGGFAVGAGAESADFAVASRAWLAAAGSCGAGAMTCTELAGGAGTSATER